MTYDSPEPVDTETRILTGRPRVTERASTTGWVVAAIVAVVAIIAVAFMVSTTNPDTNQAQIANALEQGRMQGAVDAQSSINNQAAINAQLNSQALNAQLAAERAAAQTQAAAADARDSANMAAANVADAARDANARIEAQTPQVTPAP